ncbi:PIN domain-containing protein [Kribbella sp. NPDC051718]|uniref:PIN domain-containing protein n=1 Tax=Kribbella sp. NPDC051718 TaxID=3155168 RepID=UPI003427ABF8
MTVRLLPGVAATAVLEELDRLINGAADARASDQRDQYAKYVRWATNAARSLGASLSHEDVNRLVLTQRHWVIQGLVQGELSALLAVQLELDQAVAALSAAQDVLREQMSMWPKQDELGRIIVPDTNIFLQHTDEFPDIDWAEAVKARGLESLHIVIPLVVIDELDRAKRNHTTKPRARQTLKLLNKMALHPGRPVSLRESSQHGTVDVRVLPEEVDHVRLADGDMEIVDVASALKDLTGLEVVLFTFDTGMVVRARSRGTGVTVRQLTQDP